MTRASAPRLSRPSRAALLVLVSCLWVLVHELGCYGTIPGKFKQDAATASPDAERQSTDKAPQDQQTGPDSPGPQDQLIAPDKRTTPDASDTDTLADRNAPEQRMDLSHMSDDVTPPDVAEEQTQPDKAPPEQAPEQTPDRPLPPMNRCLQKNPPQASGKTLTLSPGKKLKDVLAQAMPGDHIEVKQGTYPFESLTNITFNKYVVIKAAAGAKPVFQGIEFKNSAYIAFVGLHIRQKSLAFRDCHHIWLDRLDIDMANNTTGLQIVGSGKSPSSHHFEVHNSRITGGQRSIFARTNFSPLVNWNFALQFTYNRIECGTNNCFQFSGARDTLLQNNHLQTKRGGGGILIAGGTRIEVRRNVIVGDINHSKFQSAMNIATPGKEWDNFKNVKYMIASHIKIANNVMHSWSGFGIALNGTKHIDIFNNTIYKNKYAALRFIRRTPHDTDGKLILTGNTQVRLWNNILDKIVLDKMEPRPTLESNNLVEQSGGGGKQLIKAPPMFKDASKGDFRLGLGSPAIDQGLRNGDTPKVDLYNTKRDSKPDLGAIELNSQPATCP